MSCPENIEISDDNNLLRRIHKNHCVFDDKLKKYRTTSGAYNSTLNKNTNLSGVSCELLEWMLEDNNDAIEQYKKQYHEHYLVKLNVGKLRKLDIEIKHTPLDINRFHCDFIYKNETKSTKKKIAKQIAEWIYGPEDD